MDLLFEFLIELIFEGTIELSSSKKVPKIIRYPLIVLIVLIFSIFIIGLLILGIFSLDENIGMGIFLIILSLIFLLFFIKKIKEKYKELKSKK